MQWATFAFLSTTVWSLDRQTRRLRLQVFLWLSGLRLLICAGPQISVAEIEVRDYGRLVESALDLTFDIENMRQAELINQLSFLR